MVKLSVASLSPKQIQRLRNKHGIRVTKGDGFQVDVNEKTLKTIQKAFMKGKGVTLKLDDDEVESNRNMDGSGLFKGLKKIGKSISKGTKKVRSNNIVKGIGKDIESAAKQVKKGVSSTKGAKNLALDIAVGAIPYLGDNAKGAIKGDAKKATDKSMKGKGLQKFMRQTGRSFGKVGKTLSSVAKQAPVAAALKEISKQGLEYGTDALIAGASVAAPTFAPAIAVGLKAAQAQGEKELDDAFKKKSERQNKGGILRRSRVAVQQGINASLPELKNIATQKLQEELELRLGISLDGAMRGNGIRLSNQNGRGIMLGNGVDNLTGPNGAIQSPLTSRNSYHQHYPLQRYNI